MTEEYWRFDQSTGSWIFATVCVVIALVLARLLLRERIALQGSMSYLAFLVAVGSIAAFPETSGRIAHWLGFSVMSNFFFCVAIAALAILHLRTLVTLSRIHLRSITLTQEVALLREQLDRVEANLDTMAPRSRLREH
jgi:hypothetical protein